MKLQNKVLFILCGKPFSGKSTITKKIVKLFNVKVVGRDEIYFAINNILSLDMTPTDNDSAVWNNLWPLATQGVKNQLLIGNSVVFDDTCLHKRERDELRQIAEVCGAKSVLIHCFASPETLLKRKIDNRVTNTRHDVPSLWLENNANVFEIPTEEEGAIVFTPDSELEIFLERLSQRVKD